MNASKWIRLSPEEIAPSFHPADAKWSTESPSPYDIPSHARASYNPATGCLLIEFKYFEQEPLVDIRLDQYFTAKVGKATKRVWEMKFDAHSFNRDRKSIANAASSSIRASSNQVSNSSIAARALTSKGDSLLQAAFGGNFQPVQCSM